MDIAGPNRDRGEVCEQLFPAGEGGSLQAEATVKQMRRIE